jgi:hypothetical protein
MVAMGDWATVRFVSLRPREDAFILSFSEGSSPPDVGRGANEAIFRDTNDAIRAVAAGAPNPLPVVPFVCECGADGCRTLVRMTLDDYAFARESPRRLLVAPGHQASGATTIVRRSDEFVIVERAGLAEGRADGPEGEAAAGG